MIILSLTVNDIDTIIGEGYTVIRIYTDTSETGNFTTLDGTATLVAEQTGYTYVDVDGTAATWYKLAYYGSDPGEASKGDAFQGGVITTYCSALDVRKELATSTDEAAIGEEFDSVIWGMCAAAGDLVDKEKRVQPGAYLATESAIRYFFGSGRVTQNIDEAISISEVAVEESDGTYTVWVTTDYFEWPYEYGAWEEPIRRLEVNVKSDGTKSVFTHGQKRVKITGVWGVSAEPPAALKRACIIQCTRWYKRAQQAWQDASASIELGEMVYVQELDPDIARALRSVYPTKRSGI